MTASATVPYPLPDRVVKVKTCALRTSGRTWPYAVANAAVIDAHWDRARVSNPGYFNGRVHLIDELQVEASSLEARLLRTSFKSYLYWRDQGYPPAGVLDGFGSALICSNDDAFVLGRQRAGNINGGLTYLPGGFIDDRDVDGQGHIDIAASIARELAEETGLTRFDVEPDAGFLITQTEAQVSIALRYRTELNASALKARIESHVASDPASELADAIIVRGLDDIGGLAMPPYARVLVTSLFSTEGGNL